MDSSHVSEEEIEKYSMGKLARARMAFVEEHLLLCYHCQEQVERMDEFVAAASHAAERLVTCEPSVWERLRAFLVFHPGSAWAGVSAVALVAIVFSMNPVAPLPSQRLELSTVRGMETAAPSAGVHIPIDLELDVKDLVTASGYTVELVDAGGNVLGNYVGRRQGAKLSVSTLEPLAAGQYWVRVYGSGSKQELLREYALPVH